jgi:multidrug resistance efflux pump
MVKRILIALVFLLVAAGGGVAYYLYSQQPKDTLFLTGVVEAQEVRLGSKLGGRVAEVKVVEGAEIQPNQVLLRMAKPELEAQRQQAEARVAAAKAAYDKMEKGARPEEKAAAEAAMNAAKARWDRLEKGWREEEKAQAKYEEAAAKADFVWAENIFKRDERLHEQNKSALSLNDLETSRANRDRARGRYEAAKAKVEMLQTGSREEDKAEAKAEYERAKANFELLQRGNREEDKAAAKAQWLEAKAKFAEIEAQCAEADVLAPSKALVEVVAVRSGDLVQPNQPVIRVLKSDDVWVKVYVPETELGKVEKNQLAEVMIDSHPNKRFQGRVSHIASQGEFLPRNVQSLEERRNQVFAIKIVITEQNVHTIFKPGMATMVYLPLKK